MDKIKKFLTSTFNLILELLPLGVKVADAIIEVWKKYFGKK